MQLHGIRVRMNIILFPIYYNIDQKHRSVAYFDKSASGSTVQICLFSHSL